MNSYVILRNCFLVQQGHLRKQVKPTRSTKYHLGCAVANLRHYNWHKCL